MKELEEEQKINLYYFDESGFSTTSCVPYAWQPKGHTLEIPCYRSKQLNVLGLISRDNKSFFNTVEGSVKTQHIINFFDLFTSRYANEYAIHKRPCVIIIDNAPIHTSDAFLAQEGHWATRGVLLHYLPTYSPELNLIEILWRKVKYEWLPLSCYSSYANLKKSVLEILSGFGCKYDITFV